MIQKKKVLCAVSCLVLFPVYMHSMQLPTGLEMPIGLENGMTDSYDNIVEAGIKAFQSPAVQERYKESLNYSNESAKVFFSEMKKELSEDQKHIMKNMLSNVHNVLKEGNKIAQEIAASDMTDEQKRELSGKFMANVMFEMGSLAIFMQLLSEAIDKRVKQAENDPESKKEFEKTILTFVTENLKDMVSCVGELKDSIEA